MPKSHGRGVLRGALPHLATLAPLAAFAQRPPRENPNRDAATVAHRGDVFSCPRR